MESAVKKNISLEDRVAERIQNSEMGQFFDEDDMLDIVRRSIDKGFFKPYRTVEGTTEYNRKSIEYPSRIEKMAADRFEALFADYVQTVLTSQDEAIKAKFDEIIKEQLAKVTLDAVVIAVIQRVLQPSIDNMTHNMEMRMQQIFMSGGRLS